MPPADLEAFLARLYTDAPFRETFLRDREGTCRTAHLSEAEIRSLLALSEAELQLAVHSFEHKRAEAAAHYRRPSVWRRILRRLGNR